MTVALVGKRLEYLESREMLCDHRPKILNALSVQECKILKEWMQCLCSNVVDCLAEATSQSAIDREVQTLRLNTNQLAPTRDSTVH